MSWRNAFVALFFVYFVSMAIWGGMSGYKLLHHEPVPFSISDEWVPLEAKDYHVLYGKTISQIKLIYGHPDDLIPAIQPTARMDGQYLSLIYNIPTGQLRLDFNNADRVVNVFLNGQFVQRHNDD